MNAPQPYFSVIIPFYNKGKTIDACLRSLAGQDFPRDNYEIICVNNNSTDSSASIAENYPGVKLINLELVNGKIQDVYSVRNTGIMYSSGSVIAFTDADVEVPQDWLSNIYSAVRENNYDILIGWYQPGRPIRLLEIHSLLIAERIKKAVKDKIPSMITAGANNLIIKKHVFDKEGKFSISSNSEDAYFVIRCMEKGYNIGFRDNISIKRDDIDSVGIFMVKDFIYGCSSAVLTGKSRFMPIGWLRHAALTIKFVFRYFPVGIGLLLFTFSYFAGYLLTKSGLLNSRRLGRLIHKYTLFIDKKAV